MPSLATKNPAPTTVPDDVELPPKFPELPDDVLQRFPSLADWEEDTTNWWNRTSNSIQGNNNWVSQSVTKQATDTKNLTVSFNDFKLVVEDEIIIIINDQVAQAKRIISVSAQVGVNQNIKIQNTPPVGPALNDYWIDNSDITTPTTYQWNGVAWIEVTDPIAIAGVADERTARVTADGFLSGKYTLTVIAGNVVTGMNITSSTGGGTDVSSVIFRATDFQIYNGVIGKTMFSVSGTDVQLAGVLTVSTSGKVYTGTGTYANSNTPFYVDSSSNFSLGANLTWNGTTLTITGSISATSGTIGGWTVGATTLTGGSATLDSTGQLILGTANNVVYLSATDATYRLWVGNVTAGSATFSVTKGGVLSATGATISGNITATTGAIGGFTIGSDYIRDSADSFGLASTITGGNDVRFWAGAAFASRTTAPLRFYEDGTGVIAGFTITSDAFTCGTSSNTFTLFTGGGGTPYILFGASLVATLFVLSQSGFTLQNSSFNATADLTNSGNAGLFRVYNNGSITITCTGSTGNVSATTLTASGVVNAGSGSNSAPGYGFGSGTNYGMYLSGSNLAFTTNGTLRGYFDTSYNFVVSNGTVNMLMSIDTGSSRGLIGTGTNHTLEIVTNSAIVWFFGSDGHFKSNGGDIRKVSSDSWTVKLYDGASELEFQASGGQIFGRINGGTAILLG